MSVKIKVQPKGANDTSENTKNTGTAKVLAGKIYVLSVFVAPHLLPWLPSDIERHKQKVFESERWLTAQALRYGVHVEFVNSAFGSDGSFVDDEFMRFFNMQHAFEYPTKVLLKMGFQSKDAFVDWVRTHTNCDQFLVIVFANYWGRSFSSPINKLSHAYNPHENNVESCLIYRYHMNPNNFETPTAVIAHEILHLFGAWDLYELDYSDHNRACKTSELFPNSIMFDSIRDIWVTEIDELTAWLVGLKKEGKDWYRWFEPNKGIYESY